MAENARTLKAHLKTIFNSSSSPVNRIWAAEHETYGMGEKLNVVLDRVPTKKEAAKLPHGWGNYDVRYFVEKGTDMKPWYGYKAPAKSKPAQKKPAA